jgi:hypothetical protein
LKNFAIWRNFAQNKTLLERGAEEDLTSRPVFLGFHLSGFHSPKLLLLIFSGSERAFVCSRFAVATIDAQFPFSCLRQQLLRRHGMFSVLSSFCASF